MESKNLHERIRALTHAHHAALENTRPFSRLLSTDISTGEVKWSLTLFSVFFSDYLDFKRSKDSFFAEKLKALELYREESAVSSFSGLDRLEVLAWDYIFLGSQLGNRMIIFKNQTLREMEMGSYFKMQMPQEIWGRCLDEISAVQENIDQNFLVGRISELFQELKDLALQSRK